MRTLPNNILERINRASITEKITIFLIAAFPIFSLSIKHWLSGIYSLIALLATIFIIRTRGYRLYKEEQILLILAALFLLSFFLSATLNDWSDNSFRRVGNVMKYVFFLPLYILIRQYTGLSHIILASTVIGGTILGIHALFDVFYIKHQTALGKYGPIIFGDLAILYLSFTCILILFHNRISRLSYLYTIGIILSTLAVYLSGSRNAWLAAAFCAFLIPILSYKFITYKKTILAVMLLLLSTSFIASVFSSSISDRLYLAIDEFRSFVAHGAPHNKPMGSVDTRLEQWRVALEIIGNAPIFGHGGGNAGKHITRYAEVGLAHPDLINPDTKLGIGGLHSTYFESLVNEGIIGLIAILSFLLYPLWVFLKARSYNPLLSTIGILFICNYMIFGISENPFVHDNFSSVFLLLLAVFFSEAVRQKYQHRDTQ